VEGGEVSEDKRRVWIRLKYSLAADQEINTVMPDTLAEFEEALASGELRELVEALDDAHAEAEADLPEPGA
jgi:hypothetical protein